MPMISSPYTIVEIYFEIFSLMSNRSETSEYLTDTNNNFKMLVV